MSVLEESCVIKQQNYIFVVRKVVYVNCRDSMFNVYNSISFTYIARAQPRLHVALVSTFQCWMCHMRQFIKRL